MPRPYPPYRDAGIPTLTQRAEPTLSPDAGLPPDDDPALPDEVRHGAPAPAEDVPVLDQPADDDGPAGLPTHAAYVPHAPHAAPMPRHPAGLAAARPYPQQAGLPHAVRAPGRSSYGPAHEPPPPPRYVPPVHPGLDAGMEDPQAARPAAAGPSRTAAPAPSASIPEAVLRAALQAEIEQAVQAAVQEAAAQLRARLEAELPAIVARTLGRVRPG